MNFFGGVSLVVSLFIIAVEKLFSRHSRHLARKIIHAHATQLILLVALLAYAYSASYLLVKSSMQGYKHGVVAVAVRATAASAKYAIAVMEAKQTNANFASQNRPVSSGAENHKLVSIQAGQAPLLPRGQVSETGITPRGKLNASAK